MQTKIDNLHLILPFLKFENPFDFYLVTVMTRNKDSNTKISGSNRNRIIKYYLVRSADYLLRKYGEMKLIAEFFNARVMIYLNRRNEKDLCLYAQFLEL